MSAIQYAELQKTDEVLELADRYLDAGRRAIEELRRSKGALVCPPKQITPL